MLVKHQQRLRHSSKSGQRKSIETETTTCSLSFPPLPVLQHKETKDAAMNMEAVPATQTLDINLHKMTSQQHAEPRTQNALDCMELNIAKNSILSTLIVHTILWNQRSDSIPGHVGISGDPS